MLTDDENVSHPLDYNKILKSCLKRNDRTKSLEK